MLFSSLIFLFAFLPAVLLIYFAMRAFGLPLKVRNRFLLLVSLFFYGWGEPIYVFLMIACILANYIFGLLVSRFRQKPDKKTKYRISIIAMLVFNLGVLGIFKYTDFAINNVNSIFGLEIPLQNIILPIGISFFIFQGISYVLDVAWGRGEVQKNPLDVGLYISLFPQLIAGPIVRYNTVAAEIQNRRENLSDFASGVNIFIAGLAKKVILANNFAVVADKAFGMAPDTLSVSMAWLGAIAYTLQIYFDFGGYSDMAIGLGRMFGFHFLPNFNFPYTSRSVSDFWRRWHISLGTWFRDYVYFPLGGSRVDTKLKLFRNLLIVWALTGLWHGANWTFVVWGLYYFCFLAFEKFTHLDKKLEKIPVFSTILVVFIAIIGWVFFRAENISQAVAYLGAMFNSNGLGFWNGTGQFYFGEYKLYFLAGIICALPFNRMIKDWALKRGLDKTVLLPIVKILILIFLLVLLMASVSYLAKGSYNPFIYFNF
jgi:alginate O-acetyltransferase complex protein AlgI